MQDKSYKRHKAISFSILMTISAYLLSRFYTDIVAYTGLTEFVVVGGFGLLQAVLILWLLEFDVRFMEALHVLFPGMFYSIVIYLVFREIDPNLWLAVLPLGTIFSLGGYILLLATNILNVSTIRTVPLKKAALSTLFFIGLITFVLLGDYLISIVGWGISIGSLGYWCVMVLFSASFLYLGSESRKYHVLELSIVALMYLQIILMVNFWPSNQVAASVVTAGLNFILLGIVHHHANKMLNPTLMREYFIFALLLLGAFFMF